MWLIDINRLRESALYLFVRSFFIFSFGGSKIPNLRCSLDKKNWTKPDTIKIIKKQQKTKEEDIAIECFAGSCCCRNLFVFCVVFCPLFFGFRNLEKNTNKKQSKKIQYTIHSGAICLIIPFFWPVVFSSIYWLVQRKMQHFASWLYDCPMWDSR